MMTPYFSTVAEPWYFSDASILFCTKYFLTSTGRLSHVDTVIINYSFGFRCKYRKYFRNFQIFCKKSFLCGNSVSVCQRTHSVSGAKPKELYYHLTGLLSLVETSFSITGPYFTITQPYFAITILYWMICIILFSSPKYLSCD